MATMCKALDTLTAADIMTHDPVVIPRDLSLRAAAHLLSQSRVTGAPVVNARGECIGVLSATDFMALAEGKNSLSPLEYVLGDWRLTYVDAVPEDDLAECMTADPVTAPPTITIAALARHMIDAHIHRVIIVDEKRRPIGIVATTDILAAVAQASSS